jgi:adenylate kinase
VAQGTALGLEAKRHMDSGGLVPDEVVIGMIRGRLSGAAAAAYLLDGFPRTLPQAEALDATLRDLDAPLDAVLLLCVPRAELVRRLAGRWICRRCGRSYHEAFAPYSGEECGEGGTCDLYQRADDRAEAVENRLSTYEAQTEPLVGYYRERGLLREIAGDRGQDEVYGQIRAAIEGR